MGVLCKPTMPSILVQTPEKTGYKEGVRMPSLLVQTPAEIAYQEGVREISGRVGKTSWQVKLLQVWWQSCHLDTSIIKGEVRNTWWDVVGKLDEKMITNVVNWLLGDQEAFDAIPVDRVFILRRLKKKILAGLLQTSLTL